MVDITTISTLFTSLKAATEIAKTLRSVDSTLERAELKLKIAELTEALADVKIQATEIQEMITEKDRKIKDLESQLNEKQIRLPKESKEILNILAAADEGKLEHDVLEKISSNRQEAIYFLEALQHRGLVRSYNKKSLNGAPYLELSHEGRRYIFDTVKS